MVGFLHLEPCSLAQAGWGFVCKAGKSGVGKEAGGFVQVQKGEKQNKFNEEEKQKQI